jgi:cytochrome c oxidase subunit 4
MSTDATISQPAVPHATDAHGHADVVDDHGSHDISDKQYILIALLLAVLTALEVAATEVGLGAALVPALLVMMVVKFFTVVSYFMHLKFDNRLFSVMFYLGLSLAVTLYAVVLATFHFFS